MNLAILRNEITIDPSGRYEGKTDAQIAASLNTADRVWDDAD